MTSHDSRKDYFIRVISYFIRRLMVGCLFIGIGYGIHLYTQYNLATVWTWMGIGLIGIGVASSMSGYSMNNEYNTRMYHVSNPNYYKQDAALKAGSYRFMITMALVGAPSLILGLYLLN